MSTMKTFGLGVAATLVAMTSAVNSAELITNGGFETYTSVTGIGKERFYNNVATWGGGAGLTYVTNVAASGLYGPAADWMMGVAQPVTASPNGGNFIFQDGDPAQFHTAISQTISGLVVGSTYTLTFNQAVGQEAFPAGTGGLQATYGQWQIDFGADTVLSTLMTTSGPQGFTGWATQTYTFTAGSSTQVLSFLALGGPAGAPPMIFLDGVSLTGLQVPEPATIGLMGAGMLALGVARRRNRKA